MLSRPRESKAGTGLGEYILKNILKFKTKFYIEKTQIYKELRK